MITNEQNEDMLDVIEGTGLSELTEQYFKIEEKIIDKLSKLKNWSKECNCEIEIETICLIEGGFWKPLNIKYCLECGGYKETTRKCNDE